MNPSEPTLYTAVSNTAIGMLIFSFGALGLLARALGVNAVLVVLLVLGLAGGVGTWYMPEADRMVSWWFKLRRLYPPIEPQALRPRFTKRSQNPYTTFTEAG